MKFKKSMIACSIPLISILFDLLVMHVAGEESNIVQYTRAIIMFGIIGILIFRKISINIATISIAIFLFYVFGIILLRAIPDGEFLLGVRWLSKISISMLMFLIGYSYINTVDRLHYLNIFTLVSGAIIILYFIIVNIFGIGANMYLNDETLIEDAGIIRTGMIDGVGMSTISYVILLAPLIYFISISKIKKKKLVHLIFVLLLISLFLVLRRTAIVIVVIGFVIYLLQGVFFNKKNKKSFLKLALLSIITLPVFAPFINSMYEVRGDHVISTSAFEQDTRSREIAYMLNETLTSPDLNYLLFGESFSTFGAYPLTRFGRSLHSDISNLLYITGIIGLLLYILIHVSIIRYGYRYRKYVPKVLFVTLLVLVITSLFLMYPGRLTELTYRTIMYIYIGSILGIMHINYKKRTH